MAAIEYRGAYAVTNFDISNYIDRLKKKIPGFNTQSTTQSEALPNCGTQSEIEVEVEQQQQQPSQQEEKQEMGLEQLQYAQLPPCMDTSTMVAMDPSSEQDPWSFLDNGFSSLPVPDGPELPLEKPCELTDLFDHTGFEDDIDFIFDAAATTHEDEVNLNGILDDDFGFEAEVGVSRSLEEEDNIGHQETLLLSSSTTSSPSSSTTTSVSCIYTA